MSATTPDALLASGESVPFNVRATADFLRSAGVWFLLSRNLEARSCRDAAYKRNRLGHQGIPLHDELKSFLGRVEGADGTSRYVTFHCRGDRLLDERRAVGALGLSGPLHRLDDDELTAVGVAYGLVNPFRPYQFDLQPVVLEGQRSDQLVAQVFDVEVLEPLGLPGTMMTNAGDLTWAVEFRPAQLIDALTDAVVAPIAAQDPSAVARPHSIVAPETLGIVTGNAPESGMMLWSRVNALVRERLGDACLGDVSMPRALVASLPEMGQSMELEQRIEDVRGPLLEAIDHLCESGSTVVGLACNTTHAFTPEIRKRCEASGATFISMAESVALELRAMGVTKVGLVGIQSVMDLDGWSAYGPALRDFEVELPSDRLVHAIERLAYQVKAEGPSAKGLNSLRDILSRGVEADYIVLALTELSVLLELQRKKGRSGKVLIDPLAVYAEHLAAVFLGERFPLRKRTAAP